MRPSLLLLAFAFTAATVGQVAAQSRDLGTSPGGTGSSGTAPAASTADSAPGAIEGFAMVNGRVYLSRGGQLTPIDREMTLRISPTGTVTLFDGRQLSIPNGQMITIDGRVVVLNPGAPSPGGAPATGGTIGSAPAGTSGNGRTGGGQTVPAPGSAGTSDNAGAGAR